jgi:hypothetical protein
LIDWVRLHVPREGWHVRSVPLILICQSGCSQINRQREVYWPVVVRSLRSLSTNLLTEFLIFFLSIVLKLIKKSGDKWVFWDGFNRGYMQNDAILLMAKVSITMHLPSSTVGLRKDMFRQRRLPRFGKAGLYMNPIHQTESTKISCFCWIAQLTLAPFPSY